MPSPFPGMDPYIEDPEIWHDFYLNLAVEIRSQLNQVIQPVYVARVNAYETCEIVQISASEDEQQRVPLKLVSVEVCKPKTLELVTTIEILSPVNKQPSHDAYQDYQCKRRELLRSSAHLLEIDLYNAISISEGLAHELARLYPHRSTGATG